MLCFLKIAWISSRECLLRKELYLFGEVTVCSLPRYAFRRAIDLCTATVGFFAIQLAKLYGIEVATTCSPRNFNKIRDAGATYVYDYNDKDVISKLASALPNVQHAFDTIGNETSSANVAKAMASTGGTLCTVRPGKANTQDVPSHIKVTDVFVFTAFPTEHSYRGKAYWPVSTPNSGHK